MGHSLHVYSSMSTKTEQFKSDSREKVTVKTVTQSGSTLSIKKKVFSHASNQEVGGNITGQVTFSLTKSEQFDDSGLKMTTHCLKDEV